MEKEKSSSTAITLLQIALPVIGTIVVAYFAYLGLKLQVETPIHATQTAEAKQTSIAPIASETLIPTVTPTVSPSPTDIPTVTPTVSPSPTDIPTLVLKPDITISQFSLDPAIPTQGKPVFVRVGVYNQGTGNAGDFVVRWWAGENFPTPGCTWQVDGLAAGGEIILTCTYDGYISWYSRITTKVDTDSEQVIAESDERNNTKSITISVSRP